MCLRMASTQWLPVVLALLFAALVRAQLTTSGLTFNGADVVNLLWGYKSEGPASYDVYLCAGDETTGTYVS